jgi:hypothetical protein
MVGKAELIAQTERLPLYVRRPIHIDGEEQKNFDGILEQGQRQALAVVSKRYALVQTREAFRRVLEACPEDIEGWVDYYGGKAVLTIFPSGSKTGAVVTNSVDKSTALQMRLVWRENAFHVYLPPKVAGVRRIHVGRAQEVFGDISHTLAKASSTWTEIVRSLSQKEAGEEDLKAVSEAAGKRCAKDLEQWYRGRVVQAQKRPSVWELILAAVSIVASRKYKSKIHKEERLRRLSLSLLGYALG